ncbi:MAG: GNAT family N-acetyltransferase [Rhodospirillaceae bacterium]
MTVTVRPVAATDYAAWRPLWDGYCAFYKTEVPGEVTETTFARCLDRDAPLYGFVAEVDGAVAGFALVVLHLGTWSKAPVCYLEDLFVSESARGRGAARALLTYLVEAGRSQGWKRLYWQTKPDNAPAHALYEKIGIRTDWVRYDVEMG